MDPLQTIGFYVSSGVSLAGGLGVALLTRRDQRGVALGVFGLGLAGIYLSLSAGYAAVVALICYAGCALMFASPTDRPPGKPWPAKSMASTVTGRRCFSASRRSCMWMASMT